jgi:hypothetical protein
MPKEAVHTLVFQDLYVRPVAVRAAAAAGEDDMHSLASASLTGAK